MITKNRIIGTAILLVIVFWVVDASIDIIFFHNEESFLDELIISPSIYEIYIRILSSVFILGSGIFMAQAYQRRQMAEDEAKHSASELKRSEEFLRAIFNSSKDALCVINVHDFTIASANKAFLRQYGLNENEVIGKTCYQINPQRSSPCAPPDVICPLTDTLITGDYSITEHVHYNKDNSKAYVEVSTSRLKDGNGNTAQVVYTTRDITERKKMQEQLIAQDRLSTIGQLVAGVAHEINNPLTAVIGFSELLLQREFPEDVKADLKIVNDEANRAAKIVKNLLIFSRQQTEEKKQIQVTDQLNIILALRIHQEKLHNIQVNAHFAEGLPEVMGNASQLQQVFLNLIINAEQAIAEAHGKGKIDITAEQSGNVVRVSFTDDGPGISPENMKKLFTPFFTTKGIGKGTGLGLSISHGIITEHGGKIYAKSEPGKGTTFIVELPFIQNN